MSRATAQIAKPAVTYEDLLAVPEGLVAEMLFGELVTHPRPAPPHAVSTSALQGALTPVFQFGRNGPGGWVFMIETAWVEVAPDWACEVLSPSTERYGHGDKRLIRAKAGVPHLWHVNPSLKMLEVYELKDGKRVTLDVLLDDQEIAAPPFAETSFPLNWLWPLDPEPDAQG